MRVAAVSALLLLAVSACGGEPVAGNRPDRAAVAGFGHVHAVDVNPADGLLYAATHHGVFRIGPRGPERVADRYQDTMGFTVVGPDRFLGSGHPDVRDPGPAHLGLIVSGDAARTWQQLSLAGQADFHALSAVGMTIYGWNARDEVVMRSPDGGISWQRGASLAATDLDVDPNEPQHVLASTDRGLLESRDGGKTFAPVGEAPPRPLVLVDHVLHLGGDREPTVAGLDASGGVWALYLSGWRQSGTVGGPPEAFTVLGPDRYVAATEKGVFRSDDGGRSWHLEAAARA
jgi:hypothetical protein